MTNWITSSLEDALERLIDYRGKSPPKATTGIPVISAKVVKTTGLLEPIEQRIAPGFYDRWMTRGLPEVGDVVLTTEGPLGEVIQLTPRTVRYALGQRVVCLRGKAGKLDNTFLRYLLTSPRQQEILASRATGTTVAGVSQKALRSMPISYPAYDEQRAIGNILAALDDRIELNRRMNETLEAMARAIFRDWFVDFGPVRRKLAGEADPVSVMGGLTPDPAHAAEMAALFPAALADDGLPEGWAIGRFGDLVSNVNERRRAGELTRSQPYVPIDCLPPRSLALAEFRPGEEAQTSLIGFRRNDVLFGAMRPYFHKVVVAPFEGTTRTTVFVLRPKSETDLAFVAMLTSASSTIEFATANSSGTTIPYAVWGGSMENMPVIAPPRTVRTAFDILVQPMLKKLTTSLNENRTLAETRDYLLPRLMSGQVRVNPSNTESDAA